MTILAIETATRAGSLALAIDGVVHASRGDARHTHGARLPGEVLDLLSGCSVALAAVDRFAVISGPGSFTGLRIGMAAVQGFALAGRRQVVAVPTLDAIVEGWRDRAPDGPCLVVPWMDGQRRDVYFAAWSMGGATGPSARLIEPQVGNIEDLERAIAATSHRGPVIFVSADESPGEAALADAFPAARLERLRPTLAEVAARIAAAHPERETAPHALRPLYIRRPDAVLARERAHVLASVAALAAEHEHQPGAERAPIEIAASRPPVTIVRALPGDDLSGVEALQRRAFTNPWRTEAMAWELSHTDVARLYIARAADGEVVAYCACWLIFDELHLNSLAVDDAWRRRGVARELLQRVFTDAVASGARAATLEVRRSNSAALALYAGLGFTADAVRHDYYQAPREDALILWCRSLRA